MGEKNDGNNSGGQSGKAPAKFMLKVYRMLENPDFEDYIAWNAEGDALVIHDQHGFTEEVLPHFFRHKNYASFVRQLNMYGFNRVPTESNVVSFRHPSFRKGAEDQLSNIQRKKTAKQKEFNKLTALAQLTDLPALAEQLKVLNERNHNDGDKTGGFELLPDIFPKKEGDLNSVGFPDDQSVQVAKLLYKVEELKEKQKQYDEKLLSLKTKNIHLETENNLMWEAVEKARKRQDILAVRAQKIIMFLKHLVKANSKHAKLMDTSSVDAFLGGSNMPHLEETQSASSLPNKSLPLLLDKNDMSVDGNMDENGVLDRAHSLYNKLKSSEQFVDSLTKQRDSGMGRGNKRQRSSSGLTHRSSMLENLPSMYEVEDSKNDSNAKSKDKAKRNKPNDSDLTLSNFRVNSVSGLTEYFNKYPDIPNKGDYLSFALDVDKHLSRQDDALQRLSSLHSVMGGDHNAPEHGLSLLNSLSDLFDSTQKVQTSGKAEDLQRSV